MVVAVLNGHIENCSEVGRIMEDCMKSFDSIIIFYVYREANGVINRLTILVKCYVMNDVWLVETFFIIDNVLYEIIFMMLEV